MQLPSIMQTSFLTIGQYRCILSLLISITSVFNCSYLFQFFASFTSIWPSCTLTSNLGWGSVAGPFTTLPSSREKTEPCHGHFTLQSSNNSPSASGPPRCEQVFATAKIFPFFLASNTGIFSATTHFIVLSAKSLSFKTATKSLGYSAAVAVWSTPICSP